VQDQPRSLRDVSVIDERMGRLRDAHVAPLNDWVLDLRSRFGDDAIVPFFDPDDGGVAASILWLLEAPGPKATRERGGSGLVSCNNNDGTAENTWRTRTEAGVDRKLVVHWNVIPYYLGTSTKIQAANPSDIASAGPLLHELMAMLPSVKCVILGGKQAAEAWRNHHPAGLNVKVIECPHPSPQNMNTRPGARDRIVQAWREAAAST
jgi:hypothetical protein